MSNLSEFWNSLGFEKYVLIVGIFLGGWYFVRLIYRTVSLMKKQEKQEKEEGVSVVITCENKATELKENLKSFLEQDYPNFEIIVVDECSGDDTQEVLAEFQKQYPQLKSSRIYPGTKFRRTKKIAINLGVKAAIYDIILFSEINARPETRHWIRTMQSYFTSDTAVVLGAASYVMKDYFSIRNYFRFLRFWKTWMFTQKGINVMGNAYNMGYRKRFYLENRGFSGNSQEYIGFDVEMVQDLSLKGEVKVVKEEDARIIIQQGSWQDDISYYCATQMRWPLQALFCYHLDFVLELCWYGMLFYFLICSSLSLYFVLAICLTFLIDLILINICLKRLRLKKLFITSLTVNILGFVYKGYYSIYSIFTRKKWR